MGDPRDAVIVAALLGLSSDLAGVLPLHKTLFNVSVYVLSSLAFLGVYDGLARGWLSERTFGTVPATAAVLVDFAVNAALVAIVIGLSSDRSPMRVLGEKHLWILPHYLPLGVLLVAAVAGYDAVGVGVLAGFVFPIAGLQRSLRLCATLKHSFVQHVDGVETRIAAVQSELDRLQSLRGGAGRNTSAA